MPPRQSRAFPEYGYNEAAGRYTEPKSGRFVSRVAVRDALDAAIDNSSKQVRALTEQLRAGTVSLADWQLGMAREVKSAHLASAALAKGGWAEMSPADFGRVGPLVKEQYRFLAGFAADVASGKQRLDGTLPRRAEMYIQAGRGTYHVIEQREQRGRGMTEERNILYPGDSCEGCLAEEARGWVGIGELVPIGARICLTRCRCSINYRAGDGSE